MADAKPAAKAAAPVVPKQTYLVVRGTVTTATIDEQGHRTTKAYPKGSKIELTEAQAHYRLGQVVLADSLTQSDVGVALSAEQKKTADLQAQLDEANAKLEALKPKEPAK